MERSIRKQVSSVIGAAIATVALTGTVLVLAAAPASAGSGYVTCMNQAKVVGVWVDVNGGSDGWATRSGSGYQQGWSYNTQGKTYQLHVGCGGTSQNWASSSKTPTYSNWGSVSCYPGSGWGGATPYVQNRCFAG